MLAKKNALLVAAFALAVCAIAAVYLRPALADIHYGASYFPNVALTTQDGATVHFYDDLLKGKIVAIDLIYTHCEYACPLETARLAQVQHLLGDRVGKDIFFYSISIDPERDSPQVLKEYAEKFHAGPGWLFLTGKKSDIDLISKKLGLYSDPDPSDKDGHTPSLLVGNEATGQWMRNSALDNPKFMAITIGNWLAGWKSTALTSGKSYAEAPSIDLSDRGKYVFATHCAACHTVNRGDAIGPDLAGVTKLRTHDWLLRYVERPDLVLAAKDPIATELFAKYKQVRMPNLNLPEADVSAVLAFLDHQPANPAAAPTPASTPQHDARPATPQSAASPPPPSQ
ncbi:MAG TPA: SCO family protein [Candidatus Acidoferrum sp.]